MGDIRFPLAAIDPDDGHNGRADVRLDFDDGLVLGEDLVLTVAAQSDGAGGVLRWQTAVCDASANHLHTLAITQGYPSDAVLAAAIEVARMAYPTYVRIPEEDRPQPNPALARGAARRRDVVQTHVQNYPTRPQQ